jgi:hypothetical protein
MSMPRTIRILTALTLAFGASVSDAQDQTTAYSQPEPGERVLSFYSKMPQHAIAITHSGHVGLGMFPPGIPRFTEPGIRRGLIANLKLADERGEVVGFAAELELFPESSPAEVEDVRWETGWALAISDRGMIFLEQIEHSGGLGPRVIQPVRASGKDWVGNWYITTTVGPLPSGRGRIIGGTGEFAGITGSFVEIDRLTRFTVDGNMEIDLELRLFLK